MHIIISQTELSAALARVVIAAPRATGAAYLRNVWIEANANGEITLTATDANIEIAAHCAGEVRMLGLAGVQVSKLHDLVKQLAGEIELILVSSDIPNDPGKLQIKRGRNKYHLPVALPSWKPTFTPPHPGGVEIEPEVLGRWIAVLSPFAASEDAFDKLACLNFVRVGAGTQLFALNGHQFCVISTSSSALSRLVDGHLLVRADFLDRLRKWITSEMLTLTTDQRRLYVSDVGGWLSMPRNLADPLELDQILKHKKTPVVTLTVDKEAMLAALHRLAVFATPERRSMDWRIASQVMTISAQAAETGEAQETLDVQQDGDDLDLVIFPTKNFIGCLHRIPGAMVRITVTGAELPTFLESADADTPPDAPLIGIMPMRCQTEELYDEDAK